MTFTYKLLITLKNGKEILTQFKEKDTKKSDDRTEEIFSAIFEKDIQWIGFDSEYLVRVEDISAIQIISKDILNQ